MLLALMIVYGCTTTQTLVDRSDKMDSENRSYQLFQRGYDLYRNRRYDEAMVYLKEAHELNPLNEKVLNRMAMIEFKRGNYAIAADIYEKSCALTIENHGTKNMRIVGCYSLLARSLVQSGRPKQATKYYTSAYEYMIEAKGVNHVDHYMWLSNLTEHLERLGEFKKALNYYENFLKAVRYSEREYQKINAKLSALRKLIEHQDKSANPRKSVRQDTANEG
jgi:tetratricopeptide (TPR) repeat protein